MRVNQEHPHVPVTSPTYEDPVARARRLIERSRVVHSAGMRVALLSLGMDTEARALQEAQGLRERAIEVASALYTRTGKCRGTRLAHCGEYVPALGAESSRLGAIAVHCGDRACPVCAAKKSTKRAHELRKAVEARVAKTRRQVAFVTLTQPKLPVSSASCEESIDLLMRRFRRLTNSKTRLGREFSRYFSGGFRSLEVTWSYAGKRNKDGSSVAYSGFHPHLHVALELQDGVSFFEARAWLALRWEDLSGGKQDWARAFQALDMGRVYQLAKYCVKPVLDAAEDSLVRAREMFGCIANRKMFSGFGEWKRYKNWVGEERVEREPLLLGRSNLAEIESCTRQSLEGRHDSEVEFVGYVDGERRTVVLPAVVVWDRLRSEVVLFKERYEQKGAGPPSSSSGLRHERGRRDASCGPLRLTGRSGLSTPSSQTPLLT